MFKSLPFSAKKRVRRVHSAQVSEGLEVLDAINEAICDANGRPLQNIRIRHTILLDDPFPDPPQLADHIPEGSPEPVYATVRKHATVLIAAKTEPERF